MKLFNHKKSFEDAPDRVNRSPPHGERLSESDYFDLLKLEHELERAVKKAMAEYEKCGSNNLAGRIAFFECELEALGELIDDIHHGHMDSTLVFFHAHMFIKSWKYSLEKLEDYRVTTSDYEKLLEVEQTIIDTIVEGEGNPLLSCYLCSVRYLLDCIRNSNLDTDKIEEIKSIISRYYQQ